MEFETLYARLDAELDKLQSEGALRALPAGKFKGRYVKVFGRKLLNLSSNDYLGLSSDIVLQSDFLSRLCKSEKFLMSSSSSRLLTGNFPQYGELELLIADMYRKESALVFSSGYHANSGILPAVTDSRSLVLADKLVHASIIDGLRLSKAKVMRYAHNNYEHLHALLEKYAPLHTEVFIVTESIFSMDGDTADLRLLAELKKGFRNVYLYVDEAHAFGVRGENGLGLSEECGVSDEIDFLVGTFGKAAASQGAFVVCRQDIRDYLVNKMRTLIYTTALPPVNVLWTIEVLKHFDCLEKKRRHLDVLSSFVRKAVADKGYGNISSSQIVPVVAGSNDAAIKLSGIMRETGFYVLPLRPPTVPEGTSRLRLSLTAAITMEDAAMIMNALPEKSDIA